MSQSPTPPAAKQPPPTIVIKFGFNEGLNFGCGFFVAGTVFSIIMTIILFVLAGGVLDALLSAY